MALIITLALLIIFPPTTFAHATSIKHIGVSRKPTFSYVMVHFDSEKFDFKISKKENVISLIVYNVFITEKKEIDVKGDKFIKAIYSTEIREEGEVEGILISIVLTGKDINWQHQKMHKSIVIFVGHKLPFSKIDIYEYIEKALSTLNPQALDQLFLLAELEDKEISSKAFWGIGEILFNMGIKDRSRLILIRAGNFYGTAARIFEEMGKANEAAEARFKASQSIRWAGFFPEAWVQALGILKTIKAHEKEMKTNEYENALIKANCSSVLALTGMMRVGEAINYTPKIKDQVSDSVRDCVYSALGVIEYEKGDFEKAAEFFSYTSDKFIKHDSVVLPRYTRSLIETGRTHIAKKYALFMVDSMFPEFEAQGYLNLYLILKKEEDLAKASRFIYKVINKFPGTRWEVKARLIAVKDRKILLKYAQKTKDDPILNSRISNS